MKFFGYLDLFILGLIFGVILYFWIKGKINKRKNDKEV